MNKILRTICILIGLQSQFSPNAFAQANIISGTVYDESKKNTLPGVSITLMNRNDLVVAGIGTNAEGKFRIVKPADAVKIRFSSIGFKSQEFTIGDKKEFEIVLVPSASELAAVSIVAKRVEKADMGLVSIDKKETSSAISSIDIAELQNTGVTNVEQMIQGSAPGLQIVAASGNPGAAATIRIRGVSSITGISDPLWIVDGREVIGSDYQVSSISDFGFSPVGDINPADIESIDVLKDASATALYGSRGANGVIVVKTKRGSRGRPQFSLTSKLTGTQVPNTIPMMNGDDQRIFSIESYSSGADNGQFLKELRGDLTRDDAWKYNNNTDWLDVISRRGFFQEYNASLRGGGDRVAYYWGLGYTNQYGTTKGTGYDRFSNRFNLDYRVSNKLKVSADFTYTSSLTDKRGQKHPLNEKGVINSNVVADEVSPITYAREISSYFPVYSRNGLDYFSDRYDPVTVSARYNPLAIIDYSTYLTKSNRFQASTTINYQLLHNLNLLSQVAVDFREQGDEYFIPGYATAALPGEIMYNAGLQSEGHQLLINNKNSLVWGAINKDDHRLTVTGVMTIRAESNNSTSLSYYNGASPKLRSADASALISSATGPFGVDRDVSFISNGHYVFKDRYFLTTTLNMEGNSKQGKENAFILYPTLGFGWDIAKEKFLSGSKWVNYLKPRFSYGVTGNLRTKVLNLSDVSYSTGTGYLGLPYTYPSKFAYDNIKPETTTTYNTGLDWGLFNDKLKGEFNYYTSTTKDLLIEETLSSTLGYTRQWTNFGTLRNSGVEFGVEAVVKDGGKSSLRWKTFFNIAFNRNKILSIPENLAGGSTWEQSREGFVAKLQAGDMLGGFYGYRALGVYPRDSDAILKDKEGNTIFEADGITPKYMRHGSNTGHKYQGGDMIYDDINNDGIINELDKVQIGVSIPDFTGGFNNTFNYRNFQLQVQFQYQYGNDIINLSRKTVERMHDSKNQARSINSRWTKQGDITDMPRGVRLATWNQEASTRWVEDGSYLRLKTLSFSYELDKKLTGKLNVRSLNMFVTAYNLYTWTKYLGVDPEVPITGSITLTGIDNNGTAPPKQFTLGLRASF